jgi:MoxR-like ATPase
MTTFREDFDPKVYRFADDGSKAGQDVRDGSVYVYDDQITLAVRVALATGRSLLLLGPPGCGKSSLAAFVARSMEWNYFEQVVTSKTRAQDLLWTFDAVRRLRDAHANELQPNLEPYIEPRVLWWAFDPANAKQRGAERLSANIKEALPPGKLAGENVPSVVLIDEIDKADPDVPNDLLVSLGSRQFRVEELGRDVKAENRTLALITSNNERSLPAAFLRRCVIHTLNQPDPDRLVTIAENHFPKDAGKFKGTFREVADIVAGMRDGEQDGTTPPSTAEYLDVVRACIHFQVQPGDSPLWNAIKSAVLVKKTRGTADGRA